MTRATIFGFGTSEWPDLWDSNFWTFSKFCLRTFSWKNIFPGAPVRLPTGAPGKIDFLKFCSLTLVWYIVGKLRPNATIWWRNYQNWSVFGRVRSVWSCLGVMTSWSGGTRLRRRQNPQPKLWPLIVFIIIRWLSIPNFSFIALLKGKFWGAGHIDPPSLLKFKKAQSE